jgi:hypothetical protein
MLVLIIYHYLMHKVLFYLDGLDYLSKYFRIYREYYENLYKDSWLWSEDKIIDWYIKESIQRKKEIILIIETKLSEEVILGKKTGNTIILQWRSKYIFIKWLEDKELKERYISNIEIR